jgi:hypothetical protein
MDDPLKKEDNGWVMNTCPVLRPAGTLLILQRFSKSWFDLDAFVRNFAVHDEISPGSAVSHPV